MQQLGGEVLAISFAQPERVAAFLGRYPLPFPALADPDMAAYRTFGLGRISKWKYFSPGVLARYLKLMFRGWLPWKPTSEEDLLQLGGDFVLDAHRRAVLAYPSRDPTDRPPVQRLLEAVRAGG